jgi:hypothetical protein
LKPDVKFSHTISLELTDDEVKYIKSLVSQAPNYTDIDYRWPFDNTVAKFSSKGNLKNAFADIWEIRNDKLLRNYDLRIPISFEKVNPGEMVWVEYTIVPYTGNLHELKEGQEGERIKPGCSLRLLSVRMLSGDNSRYDFESLRKKRRIGEKK